MLAFFFINYNLCLGQSFAQVFIKLYNRHSIVQSTNTQTLMTNNSRLNATVCAIKSETFASAEAKLAQRYNENIFHRHQHWAGSETTSKQNAECVILFPYEKTLVSARSNINRQPIIRPDPFTTRLSWRMAATTRIMFKPCKMTKYLECKLSSNCLLIQCPISGAASDQGCIMVRSHA